MGLTRNVTYKSRRLDPYCKAGLQSSRYPQSKLQLKRAVGSTHIATLDFSPVDINKHLYHLHWIKIQRHNINRPYGTNTQRHV